MRRILTCTGVLGGGTALVFALATLTATLFPNGTVVNASWGGMRGGGWEMAVPQPMPVPAIEVPVPGGAIDPVQVDPGITIDDGGFDALPGDTVSGSDGIEATEPALP